MKARTKKIMKRRKVNSKAKKKSATVSNVKPSDSPRIDSSSSKAPVPLKVKAELVASSVVPSQAPNQHLPTAWQLLSEPRMPLINNSTLRCQQALEFFPTTQAPSASQILRCSLHPANPSLSFLPKPDHPIPTLPTTRTHIKLVHCLLRLCLLQL